MNTKERILILDKKKFSPNDICIILNISREEYDKNMNSQNGEFKVEPRYIRGKCVRNVKQPKISTKSILISLLHQFSEKKAQKTLTPEQVILISLLHQSSNKKPSRKPLTPEQATKVKVQQKTYLENNRLKNKLKLFKNRKNNYPKNNYSISDIINKFGINPTCYLTGKPIDYKKPGYHLDHIVPVSKGGSNELDNMQISCKHANFAKNNLSYEELLVLCNDIISHHAVKENTVDYCI